MCRCGILSISLALILSSTIWADEVESLTTTDVNVSVYAAKDGSGDRVMHFTNTTSTMSFTVNRSCRVRLLAVGGGGAGNAKRGGGEKDLNGNPIAYAAGFALGCYQPTHPGFLVIIR